MGTRTPLQAALMRYLHIDSFPTPSLSPHAVTHENHIHDALAPETSSAISTGTVSRPLEAIHINATLAVACSGLAPVSLAEVEPSVPSSLA